MKKKLLILAAVVLLALVLAVPASASRSVEIYAKSFFVDFISFPEETTTGNACHVSTTFIDGWVGDIQGTSIVEEQLTAKGPCMGGPGYWEEINLFRHYFTGTILNSEPGTIHMTCTAKLLLDPVHQEGRCTLHSGTGGLANVHGSFDFLGPLECTEDDPCDNWGEAHFDPE